MTGEADPEQVAAVVRVVADALRTELIGIYLHGSSVLGGPKPASDLDLLAVSRTSLDDRQRQALVNGVMAVSGARAGRRPVELTVVVDSAVRPWHWPPMGDFQYGEWLRPQYQAGELPQPTPMPELALTIAVTLSGNHPLTGPPPAQVLDPVPAPDLVRASVAAIPALLEDLPGDTRNVVLTLARIWTTLATGTIRSKDAGAEWALERLAPQHRPVLAHARRLYLESTYHEETWSDELRAQVPSHVDEVLAHIGRLAPQSR